MSEIKRDADKDRDTVADRTSNVDIWQMRDITSHWLERAVAAEQRVAELEKQLAELDSEDRP